MVQDSGCALPSMVAVTAVNKQKKKARKYELSVVQMVGTRQPTCGRSERLSVGHQALRTANDKSSNTFRFLKALLLLLCRWWDLKAMERFCWSKAICGKRR